jgi:hypothetical protein
MKRPSLPKWMGKSQDSGQSYKQTTSCAQCTFPLDSAGRVLGQHYCENSKESLKSEAARNCVWTHR